VGFGNDVFTTLLSWYPMLFGVARMPVSTMVWLQSDQSSTSASGSDSALIPSLGLTSTTIVFPSASDPGTAKLTSEYGLPDGTCRNETVADSQALRPVAGIVTPLPISSHAAVLPRPRSSPSLL
jgi:hypothetical protein